MSLDRAGPFHHDLSEKTCNVTTGARSSANSLHTNSKTEKRD